MDYKSLNDFEILNYIKEADEFATNTLFNKYKPMIITLAKKAYTTHKNLGIDINDLIQEGMLGFSIAVNTYREDKNVLFFTYARTCVENRILSAIKTSARAKHRILNESLSISTEEEMYCDIENFISDPNSNPEKIIIDQNELTDLRKKIKEKLTDFEDSIFELKMSGFGYKEIAQILDIDQKRVDNALQRIKNKIKILK